MSRPTTVQHGRLIALTVILAAAAVACGGTANAAPGSGASTSGAPAHGAASAIRAAGADASIANARAAQQQHDWRSIRRFQAEIIERVGLTAIAAAREDYQRAVADLTAATGRGDSQARAGFRAELRAMCEPGGLVGAFESCDGDLIVWGS